MILALGVMVVVVVMWCSSILGERQAWQL